MVAVGADDSAAGAAGAAGVEVEAAGAAGAGAGAGCALGYRLISFILVSWYPGTRSYSGKELTFETMTTKKSFSLMLRVPIVAVSFRILPTTISYEP